MTVQFEAVELFWSFPGALSQKFQSFQPRHQRERVKENCSCLVVVDEGTFGVVDWMTTSLSK